MRDNRGRDQNYDEYGKRPFRADNQSPWQRDINSTNGEQRQHRLPTRFRLVDLADWFHHVTGIARVCTPVTRGTRITSFTGQKNTRLNSSHEWISYAVFCLKKKT